MEPIKILPHHAASYFEVFYLDWIPEEVLNWYDDENMKQNGIKAMNNVVLNPNQLVQIVDSCDELCRMCPRNKQGDNYAQNPEDTCTTYDNGDVSDRNFAEILGLEDVLGGGPIIAKQFFELMKPTYEKLMKEPSEDDNGKRLPLRQMFRIKNLYSNNSILYN